MMKLDGIDRKRIVQNLGETCRRLVALFEKQEPNSDTWQTEAQAVIDELQEEFATDGDGYELQFRVPSYSEETATPARGMLYRVDRVEGNIVNLSRDDRWAHLYPEDRCEWLRKHLDEHELKPVPCERCDSLVPLEDQRHVGFDYDEELEERDHHLQDDLLLCPDCLWDMLRWVKTKPERWHGKARTRKKRRPRATKRNGLLNEPPERKGAARLEGLDHGRTGKFPVRVRAVLKVRTSGGRTPQKDAASVARKRSPWQLAMGNRVMGLLQGPKKLDTSHIAVLANQHHRMEPFHAARIPASTTKVP